MPLFPSRPHMTSAYDLGHCYIHGFVFAFTGGRLVDTNNDIVEMMNDRSEKGRTAAPSGRREIPRSLMAQAVRDETTRAPPGFASLSFLHHLFVASFAIRSDPPSPIPPCQRTKLDFRPAQYNSNLWMDKGPLSNPSSKDAFSSPTSDHTGRRKLYSAPSTSMMPFDVRTDRTTSELPPLMM